MVTRGGIEVDETIHVFGASRAGPGRPTPVWPPGRQGSYNHAETYTRSPVRSKNQTTPK